MVPVRPRLGQLLVEAGILTPEQLALTLERQQQDRRRLGTLLVEAGYLNEVQLTQVLSQQLNAPWVSLYHIDFSRQLLNLVPRQIAETYCVVPIYVRNVRGQGNTLYIAMDDPTNEEALRACAESARLPARAMIAPPSDIRDAIRVYYAASPRRSLSGEVSGQVVLPPEALAPAAPSAPAAPTPAAASNPPPPPPIPSLAPPPPPAAPSGPVAAPAVPAQPAAPAAARAGSSEPLMLLGSEDEVLGAEDEVIDEARAVPAARPREESLAAIEIDFAIPDATPLPVAPAAPVSPASKPPPAPTASVPPPHLSAPPPPPAHLSAPPPPPARLSAPQPTPSTPPPATPSTPPGMHLSVPPAPSGSMPPRAPSPGPSTPPPAPSRSVPPGPGSGVASTLDPPTLPATPVAMARAGAVVSEREPAFPGLEVKAPAATPAPTRGRMVSLTLLDGTTITLPAKGKQGGREGAVAESEEADPLDQLTARDLIAALRAVSHGADASEILGEQARWEALFAALLSLLLKKHLIADWEFVEEYKKI